MAKNRLINGRINLKLLTQECRRIIKTLEEQLAIKKELLRKNSSIECFNYYNEKLSSMARSLEILLFNRRLRKNISTRPNQTNLACVAGGIVGFRAHRQLRRLN